MRYKYPFLKISQDEILITPGKWIIDKPLIIPKGYILRAKDNVELIFKSNGLLISNSPIEFIGTQKKPILISVIFIL